MFVVRLQHLSAESWASEPAGGEVAQDVVAGWIVVMLGPSCSSTVCSMSAVRVGNGLALRLVPALSCPVLDDRSRNEKGGSAEPDMKEMADSCRQLLRR